MKLHILTINTNDDTTPEAFTTGEALNARLREIIDAALDDDMDGTDRALITEHLAEDDLDSAWEAFLEQIPRGTSAYRTHEIEVPGITALPENESFAEALVDLIERGNQHAEIRDVFTSLHRGLKG